MPSRRPEVSTEGAKHTGSHPLPHSLPLHRVPPMEAEDSTGLVLGAGECQAHCSVPLAGRGWGPSTPRVEESAGRDPGRAGSETRTEVMKKVYCIK